MEKKVYSGKGDAGSTVDFQGKRVGKDDLRIMALGKIDALQAVIDLTLLRAAGKEKEILEQIQKKLWQTAGEISCASKECIIDPVQENDITTMERFIDSLGEPPKKFIRFNTAESIALNECRIRCRELETYLVKLLKSKKIRPVVYKYINRLSTLFFMAAYARIK